MRKYLYLIKKKKIKSWLKFWLLTNNTFNSILSNIIEGSSFNLQNTVKRYFKIFNIFGNSIQDGTPNPENPVPIHSVADDVNLLENMTIYNSNHYISTLLKLNPGTYTFNYTGDSAPGIYIRKNDGSNPTNGTVVDQKYNANNITFSISETGNYYIHLYSSTAWEQLTMNNPKLQKGTVATPYSPYNYGTFTIDFEGQIENYNYTFITKPLRSLPNGVRDSLEDDGIHRRVGRVVYDGTEDWYKRTDYSFENHTVFRNNSNQIHFIGNGYGLSNYFEVKQTQSEDNQIRLSSALTYGAQITTANNIASTPQELKTWLSTHNTEVLYELEEEIIEPYTEEQQAEYDKIKELYTFDGTTNISSDDEVPPYLQIQYYMKGE